MEKNETFKKILPKMINETSIKKMMKESNESNLPTNPDKQDLTTSLNISFNTYLEEMNNQNILNCLKTNH
jgi:hypothetical protein